MSMRTNLRLLLMVNQQSSGYITRPPGANFHVRIVHAQKINSIDSREIYRSCCSCTCDGDLESLPRNKRPELGSEINEAQDKTGKSKSKFEFRNRKQQQQEFKTKPGVKRVSDDGTAPTRLRHFDTTSATPRVTLHDATSQDPGASHLQQAPAEHIESEQVVASSGDNYHLQGLKETQNKQTNTLNSSILTAKEYERRILWRAARDHRQTDHYDHSLFGLDIDLDRAVARHQREAMQYNQDRHLKEEQAKQVSPYSRQSPVAIMSLDPTYELQNKPLCLEYPAKVENLRLNNTGFSWEVKLPYQISMTTSLHGAHLQSTHRYRLDQFHCHWGLQDDSGGSEHTVDGHSYTAELHFVHYNMEKYHTFSKAARHPDGLVVLSVFIDANDDYHNHAELEKICSHLKSVQLKGEHSIIKQAVRVENLLPTNRSYWSYQGSLTTPPYLESVTWFILKHTIKCNTNQIARFRSLKSTLRHDQVAPIREQRSQENKYHKNHINNVDLMDDDYSDSVFIEANHRKTQPLNGRTIVTYDE